MIRKYNEKDLDDIIDIWLSASIKAHDFIKEEFWKSQVDNMRNIYIPNSETYVFELNSKPIGFYCIYENKLEAIFVKPEMQRKNIGSKLIAHAIKQKRHLTLCVYKKNNSSFLFYLSQGFKLIKEQTDLNTLEQEYIMQI